jgi:hypothetical protein
MKHRRTRRVSLGAGAVGDWAIFLYGLVALVCLSSFVMMIVTYRRDQL